MRRISIQGHVPAILRPRQQPTRPPSATSPGQAGAPTSASSEGQGREIHLGFFKIKVHPREGGTSAGPGAGSGVPQNIANLTGQVPPRNVSTGAGALSLEERLQALRRSPNGEAAGALAGRGGQEGDGPQSDLLSMPEAPTHQPGSRQDSLADLPPFPDVPTHAPGSGVSQKQVQALRRPQNDEAVAALEGRGRSSVERGEPVPRPDPEDDGGDEIVWNPAIVNEKQPKARQHDDDQLRRGQVAPAGGSLVGEGNEPRLRDLGEDPLQEIASYLSPRDLLAMSGTESGIRNALEPQRHPLRVANQVAQVNSLEQLRASMGMIDGLHPDLRPALFQQAMTRLRALPMAERPRALAELRQVEPRIPEPAWLETMCRWPRLAQPAADGGENWEEAARPAIEAGWNVREVARQFGITSDDRIRTLEGMSIDAQGPNTARAVIEAGGNVREVAQQFGVTSDDRIQSLEQMSIEAQGPNTAMHALRAGLDVRAVASQFGIRTAGEIDSLLCRRRSKFDPPRRSNIDPGMDADHVMVGCGQV